MKSHPLSDWDFLKQLSLVGNPGEVRPSVESAPVCTARQESKRLKGAKTENKKKKSNLEKTMKEENIGNLRGKHYSHKTGCHLKNTCFRELKYLFPNLSYKFKKSNAAEIKNNGRH